MDEMLQPHSASATDFAGGSSVSVAEDTRTKVFLAWPEGDVADVRNQLAVMLEKAGFSVYPRVPRPSDDAAFKEEVAAALKQATASVHILGSSYGRALQQEQNLSYAKYQFREASAEGKRKEAFRRFVWNFPIEGAIMDGEQQEFQNEVANNISRDIMVTNVSSAAQFIDDIRSFLQKTEVKKEVVKEYEIGFISNIQDAGDCYELIEQLGSGLKINTLTVIPEKDVNYREEAEEIILKSRLAVVYFKEASDWAISFVKQIWKQIGGVSTGVPFLLIGEDEPRRNRFLRFRGPQIDLQVVKKGEVFEAIQAAHKRVGETGRVMDEVFCPYTGLRPFNENESIFFKGRDSHIGTIVEMLAENHFTMVTGSSGDGKSSLIFAGVIPSLKGGFMKTNYTKWAVADFRPERTPLKNLSRAVAGQLRLRDVDEVENTLSYGFSALVDMYKGSDLYVDPTSEEWINADEETRKVMKKQAANLLILVDQFEEFFTNVENFRDGVASPLAQITINVLIETIRIAQEEGLPIYVVFTMRSDFIGQTVAFRGFAEMIGQATYFVPRLKREEIQEVIEAPTMLNGDRIAMRLTQRILNDLGDGIDQLPVLQHAMHQIWNLAYDEGQELDLIHYAKVGGLSPKKLPKEDRDTFQSWFNALVPELKELYDKPRLRNVLNRHANELYLNAHKYYNERYDVPLSKEDTEFILRTTFTALTKIDENRAVRNRMSLQEITDLLNLPEFDYQVVGRVLSIFREPGNTFIQPYISDDNSRELANNVVLDITHEALIRNWEKLIEWAERENRSVRTYEDFKVLVNRWITHEADSSYLLTAGPYNMFNDWFQQQKPTPAWIRRYIRPEELNPEMEPIEQATQYLEDIEEFMRLSRARIERNRRLIIFVIVIITLLFLAAVGMAIYADGKRRDAEALKERAEALADQAELERQKAEIAALEAQNQRLIAERNLIRVQVEKVRADYQKKIALEAKTEAEKQKLIAERNSILAKLRAEEALKQTQIAEAERRNAMLQQKLAERSAALAQIEKENALRQRNNALFSTSLFIAKLATDEVDAGDPETALALALEGLPDDLQDPERPYVAEAEAALYYAGNAIKNKQPSSVMLGHKNRVVSNTFSPDGNRLITTSWDMSARMYDVATGKELDVMRGHSHIVEEAEFSPDGNYIATLADDFSARMWNFAKKDQIAVFHGHGDKITDIALSPDGQKLVTTSNDNTARLWNSMTGEEIAVLYSHTDDVLHAAFSPDGSRFVTTSADQTARIWDTRNGALIATLRGHKAQVVHATFSPNGKYILTSSHDRRAKLWDARTGQLLHTLVGHRDIVNHGAFSHDGTRVVTGSRDRMARVWDVASGKQLGLLHGHTDDVYHVQFTPDDKRIATTSADGSARLWDAEAYLRLAVWEGHPGGSYHVSFSPDSRYMAFAKGRTDINIYEVLPNRQELIQLSEENLKTKDLSERDRQRFYLSDPRLEKELDQATELKQIDDEIRDAREERDFYDTNTPSQGETTVPKTDLQTTPADRGAGVAVPKPAGAALPGAGSKINKAKPLPQAPPVSQPAPPAPNGKAKYHTVKAGDTLWGLAGKYGVTVTQLRQLNNLPEDKLKEGQRVRIK